MGAAALTKGCLKRPVTVLVSLIALVIFAVLSISSITLKLMPDIDYPVLAVYTVFPGADPEEQDDIVASKIEDSIATISGVKTTIVRCYQDYNFVAAQFEYGVDLDKAYDDVKKKIDQIKGDFPDDCQDPTVIEMDLDSMDDMMLSVTPVGEGIDVLKEVNENIDKELKKLSSLAQTTITGGDERYISVELIPEYASQYGLTISNVVDAISAVNFTVPAGSADFGDKKVNLSSKVEYEAIPELEQVPVTTGKGQVIHLADVANIRYAVSDKTELSRYKGQDNVSIGLKRKQSSSAVTLSRQVNNLLPKLREDNPNVKIEIVSDSADTIIDSLTSVGQTLLLGIALSMLVLLIFFGDLKASLIVGSSMPISLLVTVICMNFMGFSLNVVTMSALVIGIGMMVDNAIVVIEMCFRKRDEGMTFFDSAYMGTKVVIGSIVGSTITTVVVYLPLAMMKGLSGQMFGQLGYTIIFALLSSLVSAMTIIPFFFSRYQPVEKKQILTNRILSKVSRGYAKVLKSVLKIKKTTVLIAILLFAGSMALATQLKTELMGSTDEGIVNLSLTFRPNLSLGEMDKTVERLEAFVGAQPEVDRYSVTINESSTSATVRAYKVKGLKQSSQDIADRWNKELVNFSTDCVINASSGSSMGGAGFASGSTKEIDIECTDREDLREAAAMIEDMMHNTDGVYGVESTARESGSKVEVVVDPVLARAKGFSPQQLAGLVYTNMTGTKAMDVDLDGDEYEVTVEFPKDRYKTVSDVESMTFTNSSGVSVPITEMAELKFTSAPQTVQKQNGMYYASVTATLTADTVDDLGPVLEEKAHALELPKSVDFAESAQQTAMNEEFSAIGQAIFIAIFLVFMVMAIQFESMIYSILIMMCVPFAIIGSVALLFLTNTKISMVSLMGILMLAGIVVNNGILYVDTTNQNREAGMEINTALIETGKSRLRPILMTTLTTILSMLPVALGTSDNARAMKGMGIVIIGGLVASTILTLLLIPTFYLIVEKFKKKTKKKRKRRFFGLIKEKEMNISEKTEIDPNTDDGK